MLQFEREFMALSKYKKIIMRCPEPYIDYFDPCPIDTVWNNTKTCVFAAKSECYLAVYGDFKWVLLIILGRYIFLSTENNEYYYKMSGTGNISCWIETVRRGFTEM